MRGIIDPKGSQPTYRLRTSALDNKFQVGGLDGAVPHRNSYVVLEHVSLRIHKDCSSCYDKVDILF